MKMNSNLQDSVIVDGVRSPYLQSGHWPYADNREAVAAAVIPFLRQEFSQKQTF
jgi:hypothetical protein